MQWPIFCDLMLMFCSTILWTQEVWMLCIAGLYPQQKVKFFQVHANLPVMSCIGDLLNYFIYWLVLFFQCCGMSNWNGCVSVDFVQENTFQVLLGVVNKESPITSIILSNTEKKKNLFKVTTIHEVCGLFEEWWKLSVPISVIWNKCFWF